MTRYNKQLFSSVKIEVYSYRSVHSDRKFLNINMWPLKALQRQLIDIRNLISERM
jgi:hypothetical protein